MMIKCNKNHPSGTSIEPAIKLEKNDCLKKQVRSKYFPIGNFASVLLVVAICA